MDGSAKRRNKAAFSNLSSAVWTWPYFRHILASCLAWSMVIFLFPFEVFTTVYVIDVNRWAYGILLWEISTIGAYHLHF